MTITANSKLILARLAKRRYDMHRHRANRYGIGFHLSFEEWKNWWKKQLGRNWMEMRGRGNDKFCMARFGDKGAYELENVKCVTNRQNRSERVLSPESCAKISASNMGHLVSAATRKKIGDANRGRVHSAKSRMRMGLSRLGKKRGPYKISRKKST